MYEESKRGLTFVDLSSNLQCNGNFYFTFEGSNSRGEVFAQHGFFLITTLFTRVSWLLLINEGSNFRIPVEWIVPCIK